LSLVSLLRLHLVFPRVEIRSPDIDLERDKDGRANWISRRQVRASRHPSGRRKRRPSRRFSNSS